jgi:hypothetical protein
VDSHWVNDPATDAATATPAPIPPTGQPTNLYLREDTILIDLAAALSHITDRQDPHSLVEYLRTNAITIVCRCESWSLSSPNAATTH